MKPFVLFLLISFALNAQEVYEPESKLMGKRHLYSEAASKIYFYIHFISARYGKKFEDPKVQAEFEKQEWYKVNDSYSDNVLNDTDRKNIQFLTSLHKSISENTGRLRSMSGSLTWEKPVMFLENDPGQKCEFNVTRDGDDFLIEYRFLDQNGEYFKDSYQLSVTDFEDEWGGYPFGGVYEAIARNYEFINIEFVPDDLSERNIIEWYMSAGDLSFEVAAGKYREIEGWLNQFKGEKYFSGNRNDFSFPAEYLYVPAEKAFVTVYHP